MIIYSTAYRLPIWIAYKLSYKHSLYFGIPGVSVGDFPWRLEIQIRFQKGARMFPWLEEMRFSEIHQTIRSVNLHWFRQINQRSEARPGTRLPFVVEFLSLKTIYNWKGGPTPPSRLTSLRRHASLGLSTYFPGSTRQPGIMDLNAFTAVFKRYGKSSNGAINLHFAYTTGKYNRTKPWPGYNIVHDLLSLIFQPPYCGALRPMLCLKRIASAADLTLRGFTAGWPIALAMRSERPWSTAAYTETVKNM